MAISSPQVGAAFMPRLTRHLTAIGALIIRDMMTRFGRHHLGFVWTVLEPMILTTGVMIIWSFIHEPVIHGVPVVAFVLTGYMPLTLWRHLTNPMAKILRNNANLLYHRAIQPVHLALARSVLEFFSTTAALLIIYFIVVSTGIVQPIHDPGLTLAAWVFTAWYFGAMGLAIAAWTEWWEPAEKFIQPANYLQLPLSGVFFMLDWLPAWAQKLLLLNPSVHCFEMFRAGFFGDGITTHFDPWYIAAASTAMTVLAIAAVSRVRDRIQLN
jgi:capsular polysaccharide transport system permease protein